MEAGRQGKVGFSIGGTRAVPLAQGHSLYPWAETSPGWLHPFTPRPPPITENPNEGLPLASEGLWLPVSSGHGQAD